MNGLPYYKAYPRDFVEGTIGMRFELKAAYRLALDLIYMQGGRLPDDARYISGLLGLSIRKWKSLRGELVDAGKLQVSGGFLSNYRADKELETLAKLQENQREKASGTRKNKDLQKPQQSQPEPEPEPEPEREKPVPKGTVKKKACRLSEDWVLPRDWGDWAIENGMDEVSVRREAERFRDYWISVAGAKAVKADWKATWRNWIRKACEDKSKANKGEPERGEVREIQGKMKTYRGGLDGWVTYHG